jgi:glycosyltransferase involved in cell wall biosynthesis
MSNRHPDDTTSRRLHVLHVSASGEGGVANVALGYIRDQVDRGWSVSVACSSRGLLGYDARDAGARTYWWQAEREPGRGVLGETLRLSRIIAEADPDVVHLHSSKAGLVGRLALRNRVPTVFQPHAWSYLNATGGVRAASLRWERFATRWAALMVCVSDAERTAGARLGIDGRTVVIPNGVSLSSFRPQGNRDRSGARKLLGLAEAPTAVCVGELTPQKGQRDLLLVWPEVLRQVPDARLVVIGDGPARGGLLRLAAELPSVTLVGARSDISAWFAAADVVVVPSRWDGMSLVPLEAMACARSVVATSVSGVVESVPDDAGAIVVPDDHAAMAAAVVKRLLDPDRAQEEGWVGRAHVEAHHDAHASAQELARVYLRVVGERRAREANLIRRVPTGE